MKTHLILLIVAATLMGCNKTPKVLNNEGEKISYSMLETESDLRDSILAQDTIDIYKISIVYYKDGVLQNDTLDSLENKFPVFSLEKYVSDSSAVVFVRTFSTEEEYFRYGDLNSLKFRESAEFDSIIQAYALDNEFIVENDDSMIELPEDYYGFQTDKYEFTLGTFNPQWLNVFDDIIFYGTSSLVMSPAVPFLGDWNNRIGSYKRQNLYSIEHLYDRTFFRKRLATFNGWGASGVNFASWFGLAYLNNRVSSITTN